MICQHSGKPIEECGCGYCTPEPEVIRFDLIMLLYIFSLPHYMGNRPIYIN